MSIFLSLAAFALGEAIEHRVTVAHRGADVAATYRARVALDTRTRGAHLPNRPSRQICRWTAAITVERALDGAAASSRPVASDRSLSGTHPGACDTARPAIEAEVARRTPAVRDRLIAAAEADRATLLAELDALRPNG
ncbi:hypothetical protein [Sphingomonas sp.]|uniref:hypothetical protein n=1 Tax=Sphingomonas sp. TaxID=28214 RepID=UPI002C6C94E8|nr:hypothetical protein [Sphingomonas sp.]HTG38922.1 hypothetical protein [Sphingomonas sp.]